MKIKDWYKENKRYFNLSEINFVFKSLGINPVYFDSRDKILKGYQIKKLKEIKSNRLKGIPLAFSLGRESFFGEVFYLNSATLIPRPETELLVEKAQELIKKNDLQTVLDLCCGCGNIGIILDKLFSGKIKVYLSDLNRKALSMAKKNSTRLQAKTQIIVSNLFSAFQFDSFNLIIANPPYVETENIKGSLLYEPKEALDGGFDGIFFLKKIIDNAYKYLKKRGYLIVEFGRGQKKKVEAVIKKSGQYRISEWIKDYAGIWRGVVLEKWTNS